MAVEGSSLTLRLVRDADELELDLVMPQGLWTERQYLALTDNTSRLVEFADGVMEILAMPTDKHQAISQFLFVALLTVTQQIGGKVQYAPLRLQIRAGKYREPDLLVVRNAHDPRRQNRFWLGADVVVEIVSADEPERDTHVKRADYAEASIPEYWMINPADETMTVLTLAGTAYTVHGVFHRGDIASSAVLAGFAVSVDDVLDAH